MKVLTLSVIPRTRKISSYMENTQQSIDAKVKVTKKTDLGFSDSSVGKESTCNARDPSSIPGSREICWRRDRLPTSVSLGSLVAQLVKSPPAMWETWV